MWMAWAENLLPPVNSSHCRDNLTSNQSGKLASGHLEYFIQWSWITILCLITLLVWLFWLNALLSFQLEFQYEIFTTPRKVIHWVVLSSYYIAINEFSCHSFYYNILHSRVRNWCFWSKEVENVATSSLRHWKITGERLLQWYYWYMSLARSDRKGRGGDH